MANQAPDEIPPGPNLVNDNQFFKTRVTPSALDESQISVIIFLDYLPVATADEQQIPRKEQVSCSLKILG
jgi:hypothetical protein